MQIDTSTYGLGRAIHIPILTFTLLYVDNIGQDSIPRTFDLE